MKLGLFFPATPWAGHPRGGAADFGRSSGVSRRCWDENQGGWCLLVKGSLVEKLPIYERHPRKVK